MAFGIKILGDASGVHEAFRQATSDAQQFSKQTNEITAGFGRARIAGLRLRATTGFGVVAAGLVVGAQAARELSSELKVTGDAAYTTQGRISNLASELLSGNIIGGLKALAAQAPITFDDFIAKTEAATKAMKFMGDVSESSAAKVVASIKEITDARKIDDAVSHAGMTASLNDDLIAARRRGQALRTQLATETPGTAAYSATLAKLSASVRDRRQIQAALRASQTGLSQRLQTAIAGAKASGATADDLAQLQRGKSALQKQLLRGELTDPEREKIYTQISSINADIEAIHRTEEAAAAKRAAEQDRHNKKLAAAARKAEAAREKAERKAAQERKRAHDRMITQMKREAKAEQERARKARDVAEGMFGSLFQGPVLAPSDEERKTRLGAPGVSAKTLLDDLQAQLAHFKQMQAQLRSLERRGAPKSLLAELRGQGVGAAGEIGALAGADKTTLSQYFGTYRASQKAMGAMTVSAKQVHLTAEKVYLGTMGGTKPVPPQTRGRYSGAWAK